MAAGEPERGGAGSADLFRDQLQELYHALANDDIAMAIGAIDAIAKANNTRAVEPLTVLLEYPDDSVRGHSSRALEILISSNSVGQAVNLSGDQPGVAWESAIAVATPEGVTAGVVSQPTQNKNASDSASNNCVICGKIELFPSRCPKCGSKFCADHKSPERHECSGLVTEISPAAGKEPSVSIPSATPLPVSPAPPARQAATSPRPITPTVPVSAKKTPGRRNLVILCAVIIITLIVVGGIGAVGYSLLFPPVWTEKLPFKNSTGQYDMVIKYRNATDVTYANLSLFLDEVSPALESAVDTDPKSRSVEYAVSLHNAAEQRQINCSLLGTDMLGNSPVHAVVAFSTTDQGMVYVDPTAMNTSAVNYDELDFSRVKFLRDHWTERQPFLNGSTERPEITSYRNASPVSYAQLLTFLASDITENSTYVDHKYTCLDFAADLYDRAEVRGIKNGLVSVAFEDRSVGHAFNVFPTTDKGFVYVDDTGINQSQLTNGDKPGDNVVYLETGKELGEFPINQVGGNLDYTFYLSMKGRMEAYFEKWKQYGADLTKYNAEVDDYNNQSADNNRFYDAYNTESNQYSAAVADYNNQMNLHNQAIQQYNSGNTGVYIPPAPSNLGSLQSWKTSLDSKYNQYSTTWNKLESLKKQLDSKRKDLDSRRTALLNSEETNWISYTPPGVVNTIETYWG